MSKSTTPASASPAIELAGVSRIYKRGGETLHALNRLTLTIERGSFTAIMGPSGSGKSTVLNLVGGLDRADEGLVNVAGEELTTMTNAGLAAFRADRIGFVFQGFNLLPVLTALQNVELPLLLAPLSRKERRAHAIHALALVGLEDRMHHRPRELSGGQEQRVAIARALATDPDLILADEPTGDLDRASADAVLNLLLRLNQEHGKTIIVVTHDPKAAAVAQRTVHLDKGKLEKIVENTPRGEPEVAAGIAEDAPAEDRAEG
ncbi:MAG: ABC transporter ATP-binding protein [Planctomycetes bacterium]|nr:ABC transporter ATP-binding protein [Planctomycetota bacterium]